MTSSWSKIHNKQEEININLDKAKYMWDCLDEDINRLWNLIRKKDSLDFLKKVLGEVETSRLILSDCLYSADQANEELGKLIIASKKQAQAAERKVA